jgi:hypothetical protein
VAVGVILVLIVFVGRFVYYTVDVMFRAGPNIEGAAAADDLSEEEILAIAGKRLAEHAPWLAGAEPMIEEINQPGPRVYAVTYQRVIDAALADAVVGGSTTLTQRLVVYVDPETGETSIAESH